MPNCEYTPCQISKQGFKKFLSLAIPFSFLLIYYYYYLTQYKDVKFLRAVSDETIPNYPDKNLPTLLIYKGGDIVCQVSFFLFSFRVRRSQVF